jgi:hypothetical protein
MGMRLLAPEGYRNSGRAAMEFDTPSGRPHRGRPAIQERHVCSAAAICGINV